MGENIQGLLNDNRKRSDFVGTSLANILIFSAFRHFIKKFCVAGVLRTSV